MKNAQPQLTKLSKANGQWSLDPGGSSQKELWREPPTALERLLIDLFRAKPQDVLAWVHQAVWHLRTEELGGKHVAGEYLMPYIVNGNGNGLSPGHLTTGFGHEVPVPGEMSISEEQLETDLLDDEYDDLVPTDVPQHENVLKEFQQKAEEIHVRRASITETAIRHSFNHGDARGSLRSNASFLVEHADNLSEVTYTSVPGGGQEGIASFHLGEANRSGEGSRGSSKDSYAEADFMTRLSAKHIECLKKEVGFAVSGSGTNVQRARSSPEANMDFDEYFGVNVNRTPSDGQNHEQTNMGVIVRSSESTASTGIASDDEGARHRSNVCVLSPVGRFRMSWDALFCLCLVYELWYTPFEICFIPDDSDLPTWIDTLSVIIIIFFTLDICLNFFTGFIKEGRIVLSHRLIALEYLRAWFWFDLAVTLPPLLLLGFGNAFVLARFLRSAKFYRVIKAVRLLRALRMVRNRGPASMFSRWIDLHPNRVFALHLFYLQLIAGVVAHLNACLWGVSQPESWEAENNREAFERYSESLLYAFQAVTVGQDMPTNTDAQQVFNILICLQRISFLVLVLRWCLWRALLVQKEAETVGMRENAIHYLKHHKVSASLQMKVFQTLNESGNVKRWVQNFQTAAWQSFPLQLRRIIRYELWCTRLKSIDLVKHPAQWNLEFVQELAMHVREEVIASRVVVFTYGESSTIAFKILQGVLSVAVDSFDTPPMLNPIPDFTSGMWVGEKAFLNPELRHMNTIVCKQWSHLMGVEAERFHDLLLQFDLKDAFEDLLRKWLWHGICGRCGTLGDHFSQHCSTVVRATVISMKDESDEWSPEGSPAAKNSIFEVKQKTISNVVSRMLVKLDLERLKPILEKHDILNAEDFTEEALTRLNHDPDANLTEEEYERLSNEDFAEHRRHIHRATTQVLTGRSKDSHYIFISHYKVESGTEAALMKEGLVTLIQDDMNCPGHTLNSSVFLDTEELRDLNQLKEIVRKSQNLLLLLTPQVLTRPWCLIEIIVACKAGIQVVPVEVQRAGMSFSYPSEAYYEAVLNGTGLDEGASKAILAEDFTMDDVVSSLRQVFMRIALPFSPHKTANVRLAELKDILKNCSQMRGSMASGRSGLSMQAMNSRSRGPSMSKRASARGAGEWESESP